MKYKGIDLFDTSGTPRTIVPPRDMIVWDDSPSMKGEEPRICKVLAIVDSKLLNGKVICETECLFVRYGHCAEIPEELKPRRATYREVSKWLAQGNGECTHWIECGERGPFCKANLYYDAAKSNETCSDELRVRAWNDTDWHEPTVDYMGIKADR